MAFGNKSHFSRRSIKAMLTATTALCAGLASPVFAQGISPAPVNSSPDSYGVDLATGTLDITVSDVEVGQQESGLVHERSWIGGSRWRDSYEVTLHSRQNGVTISVGNEAVTFTRTGATYTSDQGAGATLVETAENLVYTATDGTVTRFDKTNDYEASWINATEVRQPNGETLTFTNVTAPFFMNGEGNPPLLFSRMMSVTSTNGYKLTYEYASNSVGQPGALSSFFIRTRVTATNDRRPEAGVVGSSTYDYSALLGRARRRLRTPPDGPPHMQ